MLTAWLCAARQCSQTTPSPGSRMLWTGPSAATTGTVTTRARCCVSLTVAAAVGRCTTSPGATETPATTGVRAGWKAGATNGCSGERCWRGFSPSAFWTRPGTCRCGINEWSQPPTNAKDLAQVDEAIGNLEADRYERNLFSGERGAERYAAMMSKLEKRQAELMALPVRPELVEWNSDLRTPAVGAPELGHTPRRPPTRGLTSSNAQQTSRSSETEARTGGPVVPHGRGPRGCPAVPAGLMRAIGSAACSGRLGFW